MLAVYSADGRTYHRAGNREPILRCGAPGTEDCGSVYPPNAPFVHPDTGEIWLYHSCKCSCTLCVFLLDFTKWRHSDVWTSDLCFVVPLRRQTLV